MIESFPLWLDGRVVMQRPAKPCTPVDTRDLKSLEGNFVPDQVRLWAPMLKNTLITYNLKND